MMLATRLRDVTGATEVVDVDCAYLACGYNLRTLPVAGVCPECATAVEQSLRGDRLVNDDPARLRRLTWGAGWVAGVACALAALTVAWAWWYLHLVLAQVPVSPLAARLIDLLGYAFGVLYAAQVVGVFGLTAPGRRHAAAERAARLLALTALILQVFGMAWPQVDGLDLVYPVVNAAAGVVVLAVVRRHVRRIPRPGLARAVTVLTVAFAGLSALSLAVAVMMRFAFSQSMPWLRWIWPANSVGHALYFVLSAVVSIRVFRAFRRVSRDAAGRGAALVAPERGPAGAPQDEGGA
jgi:hypothetical protein